jgi:hypothetical protein
LGLKTANVETDIDDDIDKFQGKEGEHIGIFRVFNVMPTEIVLGENDKHLDFRISLLIETIGSNQYLTISSIINIHNLMGRIYFFIIKPFHKFIVVGSLKATIQKLEAGCRE